MVSPTSVNPFTQQPGAGGPPPATPLTAVEQPALQPATQPQEVGTPVTEAAPAVDFRTLAQPAPQQNPMTNAPVAQPAASPFPVANSPFPAGPGAMPSTASPFGVPGADDDFNFDLTHVTSNAIAAGYYLAYLSDVVKGTSRKGNPMWTWEFVIVGDGNGHPSNYAGKMAKLFTALTEEALFKLGETVEALNLGKTGSNMAFKKADAIHRLGIIEMIDSEYEGRKGTSLQRVMPYSGPGGPGSKYNVAAIGTPVVSAGPATS